MLTWWMLGLGGTSLINANVFMEADKETLAMKAWPPEIRGNVDEMDRCKPEPLLDLGRGYLY